MPIYEYQCNECNTRFELIRCCSEADKDIICETCNSVRTTRRLSTFFSSSSSSESNGRSQSGCSGCAGGNCASCK